MTTAGALALGNKLGNKQPSTKPQKSVLDLVPGAAVSLSVIRPIQARLHDERQLQGLGDNVAALFQPEPGTRGDRGDGAPFVLVAQASRECFDLLAAEVGQCRPRLRASDHTRDIAVCLAVLREKKFAGDTHARDLVSQHVRTYRWPGILVAASTQVGGREDVVDLGEVEEVHQGRASQLGGMAGCRSVVRAQSLLKRIHGE